jgi:hypothetical protein
MSSFNPSPTLQEDQNSLRPQDSPLFPIWCRNLPVSSVLRCCQSFLETQNKLASMNQRQLSSILDFYLTSMLNDYQNRTQHQIQNGEAFWEYVYNSDFTVYIDKLFDTLEEFYHESNTVREFVVINHLCDLQLPLTHYPLLSNFHENPKNFYDILRQVAQQG